MSASWKADRGASGAESSIRYLTGGHALLRAGQTLGRAEAARREATADLERASIGS